jgi:hypothetical protein
MQKNQQHYLQAAEKYAALAAAATNPLVARSYARLAEDNRILARAAAARIQKFTRLIAAAGCGK